MKILQKIAGYSLLNRKRNLLLKVKCEKQDVVQWIRQRREE